VGVEQRTRHLRAGQPAPAADAAVPGERRAHALAREQSERDRDEDDDPEQHRPRD
jgi:hypothetical protein